MPALPAQIALIRLTGAHAQAIKQSSVFLRPIKSRKPVRPGPGPTRPGLARSALSVRPAPVPSSSPHLQQSSQAAGTSSWPALAAARSVVGSGGCAGFGRGRSQTGRAVAALSGAVRVTRRGKPRRNLAGSGAARPECRAVKDGRVASRNSGPDLASGTAEPCVSRAGRRTSDGPAVRAQAGPRHDRYAANRPGAQGFGRAGSASGSSGRSWQAPLSRAAEPPAKTAPLSQMEDALFEGSMEHVRHTTCFAEYISEAKSWINTSHRAGLQHCQL